ncbi:hypothetical protein CRM22_009739 [Opisthorchis felineus]|uniref:SEA domain-containing protein n=1 Tax=Opisthorchis felineus TaxID=147828 RepID=A0A4S2L697_OPIFE|nr:hypothetical protein CRM22_009739 [Opisthorchis felineus]
MLISLGAYVGLLSFCLLTSAQKTKTTTAQIFATVPPGMTSFDSMRLRVFFGLVFKFKVQGSPNDALKKWSQYFTHWNIQLTASDKVSEKIEDAIRKTNGQYRFALAYCMSTIRPKDVVDPTSVYCVFERIQFEISDLSDTCMELIAHELTRVFNPKDKPLVTVSEHYWGGSPSIDSLIKERPRGMLTNVCAKPRQEALKVIDIRLMVNRYPDSFKDLYVDKNMFPATRLALELGPLYRNIKSVISTELYNGNYYYSGWSGIRIYAREQDVDDEIVLKDSRKIQEVASSLLPTSCSKVNVSISKEVCWITDDMRQFVTLYVSGRVVTGRVAPSWSELQNKESAGYKTYEKIVLQSIERSVLGGKLSDYFLTARVNSFAVRTDFSIFALSEITFDAVKLSNGVTPMGVFVFSAEAYAQLENRLRNLDASYPFMIHRYFYEAGSVICSANGPANLPKG